MRLFKPGQVLPAAAESRFEELEAVANTKLFVKVRTLLLHRPFRDPQLLRDDAVRHFLKHHWHDHFLSVAYHRVTVRLFVEILASRRNDRNRFVQELQVVLLPLNLSPRAPCSLQAIRARSDC